MTDDQQPAPRRPKPDPSQGVQGSPTPPPSTTAQRIRAKARDLLRGDR